jgi:hypothetical protein
VGDALPDDAESAYLSDGAPGPVESRAASPAYGAASGRVGIDPADIWSEEDVRRQVRIETVYWGYIKRQRAEIAKFRKMENRRIPPDVDYDAVGSLLAEARQKLKKVRPESLGRAARIPGVTPADVAVLMVHLERGRRARAAADPAR